MNRIIDPSSYEDMRRVLKGIDVSSQGVENMIPKAFALPVKLTGVEIGAANIIKQEMLTVGGDAAIARGIVEGKRKETDIILLGTVDKIRKLIQKLSHYTTFGIPKIRTDLAKLMKIHSNGYQYKLNCREKVLFLNQVKLMGILNITPDSFSDGGEFLQLEDAVKQALQMYKEGADIVDVGGESTRPGALPIDEKEELARIIPVIIRIRELKPEKIISVDTYKASVARKAIEAGADIVNDITALRFDIQMTEVLRDYPDVPVILMHMQGTPQNMQKDPRYDDVVDELLDFFEERITYCLKEGINDERIIIDPGIGFGKAFEHNMEILRRLKEFQSLGVPVMLGASKKSFIDRIYSSSSQERLNGSLAVTALAFQKMVHLVRIHDVKDHQQLLQTLQSIYSADRRE
ncbi:MAG: dihydropteroate synthase [Candidatus Cloacimonetes bacterium]|nr:dihydropteroate synthase [Candidatus Cloacimonadota bacterium]